MSISEDTLKALKELGLSGEYEVQAYVALVDGGPLTASEVSAKSKVPFSRVYDVLGRLEEKGFIQVGRGRPTSYTAKAPTEVVRLVQLSIEERIVRSSKTVVEELQPRYEQETQASPRDVWLLHGRAAIIAKAIEMLEGVREEVLLSIPDLDTGMLDATTDIENLADVVMKLFSLKGARIQVLTARVGEELRAIMPDNMEIRLRAQVFGAGLVVDGTQTLIMLAGGEGESSFLGVFSSHVVFAQMASGYFLSLWSDSNPL